MTNISRNLEKREEIQHQIEVVEANRELAIAKLDAENISDEEWERRFEEIYQMFDTSALILKKTALEYHENHNVWFKNFVESFGECKDNKISFKQAGIFFKYTEPSHNVDWDNMNKRYVRVGNLFVELERLGHSAWITIRRFK